MAHGVDGGLCHTDFMIDHEAGKMFAPDENDPLVDAPAVAAVMRT